MCVPKYKHHTEAEQAAFSVVNTETTNITCSYSLGLELSSLMCLMNWWSEEKDYRSKIL